MFFCSAACHRMVEADLSKATAQGKSKLAAKRLQEVALADRQQRGAIDVKKQGGAAKKARAKPGAGMKK